MNTQVLCGCQSRSQADEVEAVKSRKPTSSNNENLRLLDLYGISRGTGFSVLRSQDGKAGRVNAEFSNQGESIALSDASWAKPVCRLSAFLLVPLGHNLERAGEDGTRAGAVGFADQALAFHLIEHGGGAAIADAQAALQD